MTIKDLKILFQNELRNNYTSDESAELLVIFVETMLGLNRIEQRLKADYELNEKQINEFKKIISQLRSGQPYQQILGETEFYGLKFLVDKNVLIPRPETEELLELAIKKIKEAGFKDDFKILDIGTGSGIIAIILKKHFPEAKITAIDFSKGAMEVARKNAELQQVEINFIHQDYLTENLSEMYDVIISNPPYIGILEHDEISYSVKDFEPKMALFSPNENTLIFYEKIAKDCGKNLSRNGLVFLEINQKLGHETKDLFKDTLSEVHLVKDLSENDRFVWGKF